MLDIDVLISETISDDLVDAIDSSWRTWPPDFFRDDAAGEIVTDLTPVTRRPVLLSYCKQVLELVLASLSVTGDPEILGIHIAPRS